MCVCVVDAEDNRHGLRLLCVFVHLLSGKSSSTAVTVGSVDAGSVVARCICDVPVCIIYLYASSLIPYYDCACAFIGTVGSSLHIFCSTGLGVLGSFQLFSRRPIWLGLVHAEVDRVFHMWYFFHHFCSSYSDSTHYLNYMYA